MVTEAVAAKRHRAVVPPAVIRAAIDATGLSQRAIAHRMDVPEKRVSRLCTGKSPMDTWAWPRFLEILGLPADWTPPEQE